MNSIKKRYINSYIITTTIMLISMFTPCTKFLVLALLAWVINILWITYSIFKERSSQINEIVEHVSENIENASTRKERIKHLTYKSLMPICAVAVLVVFMLLGIMFFA